MRAVWEAAAESVGCPLDEAVRWEASWLTQRLEAHRRDWREVEAQMIATARRVPGHASVISVPGVGPILAAMIQAALGNPHRFEHVPLLMACAAHRVSPSDPKPFLPDRSSEVSVGESQRAEIRGVFGTPVVSSAYWGFDLFRTDLEQTDLLFAVTPWPVPFARFKDRLQRYTLVAYGSDGRARSVATGLFRKPAPWRNTAAIAFDFPSLHLRAGELLFFVDPEGAREANLLVSPRGRDGFLRGASSSGGCTVVLGCGGRACVDQLSVDAGPVRRLPLRTAHAYWFKAGERESWLDGSDPGGTAPGAPWLEALVAVGLAPGEHALEVSAKHLGGRACWNVTCRPGQVAYVVIHAASDESFWHPSLVDWWLERSEALPEGFARRPLVLLDDGRWCVDAEPGR